MSHDALPLPSGLEAVDRYLERDAESVKGMSSRFAAAVCARLLRVQSELGVRGHVVELGAFEGRFLFALAHALQPNERALGIDIFNWPDEGVEGRFRDHAKRFSLESTALPLKADLSTLHPDAVRAALGAGPVRFVHIDGDHAREPLRRDLALALNLLAPGGVLALDDMLHPAYPTLMVEVWDFLRANSGWRVLAVLDREDIVAATKFILCRVEDHAAYEKALMEAFPAQVWPMGAEFESHWALVLASRHRLADV